MNSDRSVQWEATLGTMRSRLADTELPSVTRLSQEKRDPFRVLISTMISLRTKDEVTSAASRRLFDRAATPAAVAALKEEEIADLIYPAGFYRTKAAHIRACSCIIERKLGGRVPSVREELVKLPGVGGKTANLTLNLGFGIEAICVDTHVHRISNRLGWVQTRTPAQTEQALEEVLPRRYWIEINSLLVAYGKKVCTPVSPKCTTCPLDSRCPKNGVSTRR